MIYRNISVGYGGIRVNKSAPKLRLYAEGYDQVYMLKERFTLMVEIP
jgi:hypothetical protein